MKTTCEYCNRPNGPKRETCKGCGAPLVKSSEHLYGYYNGEPITDAWTFTKAVFGNYSTTDAPRPLSKPVKTGWTEK